MLRIPRTARRRNISVLEDIKPVTMLEDNLLKYKLQHFEHGMKANNSLHTYVMLRKGDDI